MKIIISMPDRKTTEAVKKVIKKNTGIDVDRVNKSEPVKTVNENDSQYQLAVDTCEPCLL